MGLRRFWCLCCERKTARRIVFYAKGDPEPFAIAQCSRCQYTRFVEVGSPPGDGNTQPGKGETDGEQGRHRGGAP